MHETEKEDLHKFYELDEEEGVHDQKSKQCNNSKGTCVVKGTYSLRWYSRCADLFLDENVLILNSSKIVYL